MIFYEKVCEYFLKPSSVNRNVISIFRILLISFLGMFISKLNSPLLLVYTSTEKQDVYILQFWANKPSRNKIIVNFMNKLPCPSLRSTIVSMTFQMQRHGCYLHKHFPTERSRLQHKLRNLNFQRPRTISTDESASPVPFCPRPGVHAREGRKAGNLHGF